MKAFVLRGHGGAEALEFRTDIPVPEPAADEVRIAVSAAGLNNTDLWTREGTYGTAEDPCAVAGWKRRPLDFPRIQGGDVVGRIDAVGAKIDRERIGERVLVNALIHTIDPETGCPDVDLLGSERDGGFAQYTVVPADNAMPVISPLSDEQLACLPIAYVTAEHMLARTELSEGERLLVTGASGGVGSALVQLGRARDADVLAVTDDGKIPGVMDLGAHETVSRTDFVTLGAKALPECSESIDVAADVVGGSLFPLLLDALAYWGRYVTAGAIAGPLVDLDLRTVYLKQLTLIGSTMGGPDDFARVVRLADQGAILPRVAERYPLEELPRAQERFRRKDFVGNIVIVP